MLEKITGVKIKGGRFTEWTQMEDILKHPFNILYGTNGSGKSTLAKALHDYGKSEDEKVDDFGLEFLCNGNVETPANVEIHVFNEDFINNKTKITEDTENNSLNAIMMVGEQLEKAAAVKDLGDRLHALEAQKAQEEGIRDVNNTAPLYAQIETALRKPGDYADNYKAITGAKRTPKCKDIIDGIIGNISKYGYTSSSTLMDMVKEDIRKAGESKGQEPYTWRHSQARLSFDINSLNHLLSKVVHRPVLTEHEEWLVNISAQSVEDMRAKIIDTNVDRCPLCKQPITQDYRAHLREQINSLMNKEVEDYKAELIAVRDSIKDVEVAECIFPGDHEKELMKYANAVRALNDELEVVRDVVNARIQNLFGDIRVIDSGKLTSKLNDLNKAVKELEDLIDEFNRAVNDDSLLRTSIDDAMELAYMQHKADFDNIVTCQGRYDAAVKNISGLETKIAAKQSELNNAKARQTNSLSAMKFINECLRQVFADGSRMQLDFGNDSYTITVNGKAVSVRDISTGERNILALAYFFASMFEKKSESERYTKEMLVVIDDPVSSFDFSNKAGVMTFLQDEIHDILTGSWKSKVLLISHDLEVATSLQTIYNQNILGDRNYKFKNVSGFETEKSSVDYNGKQKLIPFIYQLKNNHVFVKDSESDYHDFLKLIYEFAKASEAEADNYKYMQLGNIMRQVAETYGNLMYRSSYTYLFSKAGLNKFLPMKDGPEKEAAKNYFSANPFRFVLNSESHATSTRLNKQFTPKELQPLARMLLLYIAITNKNHLLAFLRDVPHFGDNIENDINNWKKEMMGK